MHFLTFFALVFLQTLRLKYSVTFMQILFACIHTYKISFFYVFYYYYYLLFLLFIMHLTHFYVVSARRY